MKPIKKFSMISSGAEAINESANENQEAVMNLLNKMGYTSIEELKKEKNLLSKLEALVKEFDAKNDISEEEIEEDRAEDIEADIKAKGKPRSLEGEEGDKEEDGEVGASDSDGEVAEEEEVEAEGGEEIEEDKAKDVEQKELDIARPKQLDDKAGEKVSDDQEITDEVPAEGDDETSGRKIKTFEEYIKEKEVTVNKNIKYHDDDEEPEDYSVPVAASAEPLAEDDDDDDDDEERGSEDERKGDELEDKGDKKVDDEDDKEKEDHYKGAVKSDDEEIDALKKDVEYDEEEEDEAKKDESRIMSFANFVTEGYGKMEDEEEEKKEEGYGKMEDEEEGDEEVKEKYDKVVLGGNKGDKSKTHSGEDYEKDEEEEGDEEVKESNVSEKEITNDADFKDYAFAILKDAHGDKFDEAKAMEVVDGLKDKYKGDYGAMVGALQSTMGS